MGNPSFASTCYPRITLIGYHDLGTRVVRVVEVLVDPEWSVVVRIPHNVDLDPRGKWCIRVYTGVYDLHIYMISMFGMIYVICHEFWVSVRPTQDCAGVFIRY